MRSIDDVIFDGLLNGAKPAELPVEQPRMLEIHRQSQYRQADRGDDSAERAGAGG
jgi:hypothetical protein